MICSGRREQVEEHGLGGQIEEAALPRRGRTGFDRIVRGVSGVSWLVSWPRKKLTKIYVLRAISLWPPNKVSPTAVLCRKEPKVGRNSGWF